MHRLTAILLAVGLAATASGQSLHPDAREGRTRLARPVANIYYNVATGERIAMRFDQSTLPVPSEGRGHEKGANGFFTVAPYGCTASPCPAPTDPPGVQDFTDIYESGPSCPPSITPYIGAFQFGGFDCATGTTHSSAYIELYGSTGCPTTGCSPADTAPHWARSIFPTCPGSSRSLAPATPRRSAPHPPTSPSPSASATSTMFSPS
ncbi:MAG: hypothetical protein R3B57_06470 [Phycisphaerales bacterium]